MKRVVSIVFALALVVGLGPVAASPVLAAGTIHVPGNYATIQEAIDAADPGDTIMVAAGTYGAFQVVDKNNIHIIGAEGATVATTNLYTALPIVGNAWVLAAVYDSEDVNIEGINFDGTGVSGKPVVVGIAYVDSTGRIAHLTVENVIATELGAGVAIIGHAGTSAVEMTGATIANNDNAGIYVCGGSTLEAHFDSIVGNAECGLLNDGGGMVDATSNWWGHNSGPWHLTNLLGRGDRIIGDVTFKPWLAGEIVTGTVTDSVGTVDALVEADTEVVVHGTATVTIAGYASNPQPEAVVAYLRYAAADSSNVSELNIFTDVRVTNTTYNTWIEIRLYYTGAQATGFNETSLRPLWLDGIAWKPCSPVSASNVNTTDITIGDIKYGGYMWANITSDTTPSLTDLDGTPWGGYGHPSAAPRPLCFIATAAYGTDTAKELDILREFRDKVLMPNRLGATAVSLYHETSPVIADFISRHDVLRTAVRVGLVDPIVKLLTSTHDLWSYVRP
jgi:hypothetical protein